MTNTPPQGWNDMKDAPDDGRPILGLCQHAADPYHETEWRLTTYAAHSEAFGHVPDGPHVLEWGGEDVETGEYGEILSRVPDWWFRFGSNFEEPANPIGWLPIPHSAEEPAG